MGGLKKYMPWTCRTMWVGTAGIAGVPLLSDFSARTKFFGKHSAPVTPFRLAGSPGWRRGLTAFYMFRLMFLTSTARNAWTIIPSTTS